MSEELVWLDRVSSAARLSKRQAGLNPGRSDSWTQIAAKSTAAAKAALSSFQGVFSEKVTTLAERLKRMRVEIEAAIDFPDEDIEILEQAQVAQTLAIALIDDTMELLGQAEQGRANLVRE